MTKSIVVARVPESFHRRLKSLVAQEGTSIQEVVWDALRKWVADRERSESRNKRLETNLTEDR